MLDMRALEAQYIRCFLLEVKLWESMPNHREPFTAKMVPHIRNKCKNKHIDSLDSVLCDWIALVIFYGFQLSEWAQKSSDKTQPRSDSDSLSLAFIPQSSLPGNGQIHYPPVMVGTTARQPHQILCIQIANTENLNN